MLKADRSTASITSSIMSAHDDNWRVQWETLDLLDIQNSTTKQRKMNDDSLKSILICIDAVNNLKSLKLTSCDTIIGYGLKPLRGSTVIERLDLSMAEEHSKPPLGSQSTMSLSAILPILYSIVNKEENSLRHIHSITIEVEIREESRSNRFHEHVQSIFTQCVATTNLQ